VAAPAIPPSAPYRLTQPVADAATAAGVVFADGVARAPSVTTYSAIGDSLMVPSSEFGGTVKRATRKSAGRHRLVKAYAVAGTRTDQIIATQLPQALADGNRHIAMDGGVNDVQQAIPVATIKSNLIKIWQDILAAGKLPLDVGFYPNNNTYVSTLATLELWRQIYTARKGIPHADVWTKTANAAGGWLTGLNFDTTHPVAVGAEVGAGPVLAVMDNPFKLSQFGALMDFNTTAETFPNAVSFGGVGAALPTGYNPVGTGATYSVEAPNDGSFGNWLCASYTSAVTQVGFYGSQRTLAQLGISAGDRLAVAFRVKISATAAGTLSIRAQWNGSVATQMVAEPSQPLDDACVATEEDYIVYFETTVGAGALQTDTMRLQFTATTTGTGAQKLCIQRPIIYNLTAAGL
jgi:lysophospholipase L1-like esterase